MERKRNLHYMQKTIKELFEMWEHENGRANKSDALTTKRIIAHELYERVDKAIRVLESGEDVNIDSLYNEFIQAAVKK